MGFDFHRFYGDQGFATGVGWALIHGAGPLAVMAFLPLAIGLGLLWGGFVFLRRKQGRQGLALFAGLSIALLVLNEWLLPTTPLKAWSSERALKSAEVLSIRDEIVTTATGIISMKKTRLGGHGQSFAFIREAAQQSR